MKQNKIKVVDVLLRDAHQSLAATRMRTREMVPALELLDEVGYHALEVWGGATFDSCLRYLNEDPWQRLDTLKQRIKKTPLQMLLRGQNILGYKHYPDDILTEFIKRACDHGIDIFRVFDALNDPRNIQKSVSVIKEEGAHAQLAMSYTTGPVFDIAYYVDLAKEYEQMGADSICIKDMSGLLKPFVARELVRQLKDTISVPIEIHAHTSTGLAQMCLLEAIHSGVDIIDTALSPFSGGTSHPATESMVMTLQDTPYDTGLDIAALSALDEYFTKLRNQYIQEGIINPKVLRVNIKALQYQVPGGMLSNMIKQLHDLNKEELFDQVMQEIPKVRKDLGYPPLVTPMSQMVGAQALFNVMASKRYAVMPKEVKAYISGAYGRSVAPVAEFLVEKVKKEGITFSTGRPADQLPDGLGYAKEKVQPYSNRVEDALSYALFPDITLDFLAGEQ